MQSNSDFNDLLHEFYAADVRFLIVGAYAVARYSRPRATADFDLWIDNDRDNARRVYAALGRFGAPLDDLTVDDLTSDDCVFQIGVAPARIDILTAIDGVDFATAWEHRETTLWGGVPVSYIGRDDLIANKRVTGRAKDLADIEMLEKDRP